MVYCNIVFLPFKHKKTFIKVATLIKVEEFANQ